MRALFFLLLISSFAHADGANSAYRAPGKSFHDYKKARVLGQESEPRRSPADLAIPFDQFVFPDLPSWNTEGELMARFQLARDLRWMETSEHPGFPRRASWLFPDDGCYARAQTVEFNLRNLKAPLPMKIFVFGNLALHTPNIPGGLVTWWYHVAPIIQVAGQKYVLDPSIEAHRPLPLEEWLNRLSRTPNEVQVAICTSGTYGPDNDCASLELPEALEEQAEFDEISFLNSEWERILSFGRDPLKDLGDQPPWLH